MRFHWMATLYMKNRLNKRRIWTLQQSHPKVPRKRYSAAELIAQCDVDAPMPTDLQGWDRMAPVGSEFGCQDDEHLAKINALADAATAANRASDADVTAVLARRRHAIEPILTYLQDK